MMFSAVPKQVIDIVWDDVVKVLKPAVDTAKGKLGINDIKDYLSKVCMNYGLLWTEQRL